MKSALATPVKITPCFDGSSNTECRNICFSFYLQRYFSNIIQHQKGHTFMENHTVQTKSASVLTVESGRPKDVSGRLETEIRTYDLLDSLHIPYTRVDHEAAFTIDACNGVDELLGIHICKNLFLCNSQKTNFYLLLMPGHKKFRTKVLSKQIGSARLSFADDEHMTEYLGLTPGSVSIIGLMNDPENHVKLLIDSDVLKDEYFGCHPCINTSSLRIKTSDVMEKFLPAVHHEPTIVDLPWEE